MNKLYRGIPCELSDLQTMGPGACGEMFFGLKPSTTMQDALRDLREQFEKRFREHEERLDDQEQQLRENQLYIRLETTPSLICAGIINKMQKRVQKEFTRTARFVARHPDFSPGVQALRQFLGSAVKSIEGLKIGEVCFAFCKKAEEEGSNPAARELLTFMVDTTMKVSTTKLAEEDGAENPGAGTAGPWIEQWAAFKQAMDRRHRGGHPEVIHRKGFNAESERLAEVEFLFRRMVETPGAGCGTYDFDLCAFQNLARLALKKSPAQRKLMPCNVWFGGDVSILNNLFGSQFQTSSCSYLVVDNVWLADFAVIFVSRSWMEDLSACFARGVKKVVAITESEADWEFLKRVGKEHRANIQLLVLSNDAEFRGRIFEALRRLISSRPSKKSSFLMVALGVELESEIPNLGTATVIVEGRVERGKLNRGMELVFEGGGRSKEELHASKFTVSHVQVTHVNAPPVPGARVTVKLTGPAGRMISPGQLLADFRDAERSRMEFEAMVVNISSADFVTGNYKLECAGSSIEYDVWVEVKAKLLKHNAESKPANMKTLVMGEAAVLRSRKLGKVRIVSKTLMPVLPQTKDAVGNYGCSRFIIKTGPAFLLAGQAFC